MGESETDMAVYRPKETFSQRKVVYLTTAQEKRLSRLMQCWTALDRQADPAAKDWGEAEAMRRLFEAAMDSAWAELGQEPEDDEAFARLLSAIGKRKR